jgi:hypothetical protein
MCERCLSALAVISTVHPQSVDELSSYCLVNFDPSKEE